MIYMRKSNNIKIFFANMILHLIAVVDLDYAITPSFSFLWNKIGVVLSETRPKPLGAFTICIRTQYKNFSTRRTIQKLFQFPKSFGSAIIKSCWYPGSYLNFVEMEHCFSESVFLKLLRLVVLVSFTSYTSLALTLWLKKSFSRRNHILNCILGSFYEWNDIFTYNLLSWTNSFSSHSHETTKLGAIYYWFLSFESQIKKYKRC